MGQWWFLRSYITYLQSFSGPAGTAPTSSALAPCIAPASLKHHQGPVQSWALPLLGFHKHSQNGLGCCQQWGLKHSWHLWSLWGFVLEKLWLHGNATEPHARCYLSAMSALVTCPIASLWQLLELYSPKPVFSKARTQPLTELGSWSLNAF